MSLAPHFIATDTPESNVRKQIECFVKTHILPNELLLSSSGIESKQLMAQLSQKAKKEGLRGLYYPLSIGGKIAQLSEYVSIAESEGYSEFGPAIFGSYSALDAHMLNTFGSKVVKKEFLEPLVQGKAMPCFGMTEPNKSGSIPALMSSYATLENGEWVINGGKWFISNAHRASFMTVMVRTEKDVSTTKAFSKLIIPTDTAGFSIQREISVLGRQQGQCEISLENVRIPEAFILGERGQGMWLAGQRLHIGRLLRSAHWLGLANRCVNIMQERILSSRGQMAKLSEKQLVRQHIFHSHHRILSAQLITKKAAISVDQNNANETLVNLAKFSAAKALSLTADSAVQILGSDALDDKHPLSGIYRTARTTRILDGTDESLISAVGKKLIHSQKASA